MFRDSYDGIEEYTTSVTCFINKCIGDVIPTVTVRTYPNQKPWVTGNIRKLLQTTIIDYSDASLPDKLNAFYAHFDTSNTEACMRAPAVPDDCVIRLSVAVMSKIFKQVNIQGQTDYQDMYLIKVWVDKLASVFIDIFNLSLTESVICFKQTTIVPVPKKAKVTKLCEC
jgi:hypothetical protein